MISQLTYPKSPAMVLNMAEQLATAAKLSGHEKASSYDAIACTLREKLPFTEKQFKAYFVALLADKEYAKVLEAVAKVDKSFKSSVPSAASGSSNRVRRQIRI